MKFNKKNEEKILYDQFVAGAFLKFKNIDNVDFSLLANYFEKKTNTQLTDQLYYSSYNIEQYIDMIENCTLKLVDGISLDDFIEKENCTLREKLEKIAGSIVTDFFENLDVEKYKQEKTKLLSNNKKKVLDSANVLLISDIQDDYDELVKYGFKNVDYFKSIIRADKYFSKHPEELEKYHIILKGNQNVQHCCFDGDVELDRIIDELRRKNKYTLNTSLYRYDYSDHMELKTYLGDKINNRSWDTEEQSYPDIFDRIVENTLINHTLEKAGLKDKKFAPIQDYINPNRLPLPTKKSDLKILYLDSIRVSEYADRIASELGLNVDFKEDDNCSLGKYVKNNLGEYDIIIASRLFSSNLLNMNYESTEQCKDTGRDLTLLVTYDDSCYDSFYFSVDKDLADSINLNYVFGGNFAPDYEYHNKEFRILRQPIEVEEKEEYLRQYSQSEYSQMKGILEASVNLYNQAILKNNNPSISDLDLKSADDLDQEYINAYENKKAIREAELAPIRLFDNIRYSTLSYLKNKKKGLINEEPKGLRITEGKNGIKLENIYEGRTLCTIVFPKDFEKDDLRILEIQTLSKKGNLLNPQTIGLYTSKYKDLESIPKRPDEKQNSALASIEKKVKNSLIPLNKKAFSREIELNDNKKLVLKKQNNNK